MDKEKSDDVEKENVEMRIGEMKKQFQKSYEIFMNANVELSKLSFDNNLKLQDKPTGIDLNKGDINEILTADSLDESIELLRCKIDKDDDKIKSAFPDISKLLKIMSNLQLEMDGLNENQNLFAKLAIDVNEEMNRFEKEIELSANQLSELTGDHSDEEEGEEADDEISDSFTNQIDLDEKNFDSEFCSD